ncbi:tripartite tricarboxylate transporter substrate binding protein [Ornithinimicrobium cavernae]|uniref:tripartite tricarboxylate transporter substrate binding protein n=1 Tax=Ornithinimicrobium cavernae TaxID=2666047 RepID=UPI000D6887F2|nr:tripartite tricarboxylate transporter substrate binding protein [Ornithinimicrobium cavernae]
MDVSQKRAGRVATVGVGVLALTLAGCGSDGGDEDAFPSRPIEVVVPFAAGGGTDQIARALAKEAESTCGTSVTIANEEGASGTVGLKRVLGSPPDGYTLAVGTSSQFLATHQGVSDVTPEDMTPLMQFNFDSSVLSVSADSEYQTIEDFLGADTGGLTVATSGTGSIWELSYRGMADAAGITPPTNVPYDGAAPAIVAVLGGEADATSVSGVEALTQIESGELKPLASMSAERLAILPDVPTLKESGVEWESGVWRGLVGPLDMPEEVTQTIIDCFGQAAEADAFTEFMDTQGYEIQIVQGEEFATMLQTDFDSGAKLVSGLG